MVINSTRKLVLAQPKPQTHRSKFKHFHIIYVKYETGFKYVQACTLHVTYAPSSVCCPRFYEEWRLCKRQSIEADPKGHLYRTASEDQNWGNGETEEKSRVKWRRKTWCCAAVLTRGSSEEDTWWGILIVGHMTRKRTRMEVMLECAGVCLEVHLSVWSSE